VMRAYRNCRYRTTSGGLDIKGVKAMQPVVRHRLGLVRRFGAYCQSHRDTGSGRKNRQHYDSMRGRGDERLGNIFDRLRLEGPRRQLARHTTTGSTQRVSSPGGNMWPHSDSDPHSENAERQFTPLYTTTARKETVVLSASPHREIYESCNKNSC
jgi:hypothetical protein